MKGDKSRLKKGLFEFLSQLSSPHRQETPSVLPSVVFLPAETRAQHLRPKTGSLRVAALLILKTIRLSTYGDANR